ncbi:hypothetical protein FQZ97_202980 [compost metagenome]
MDQVTAGSNHIGGNEIVAAKTVPTPQPANAARQSESGDTRRRNQSAGRGASERRRCGIDIAPGGPAFDIRPVKSRRNADGIHRRHVDHQPAIADGIAGDIVSAAANGNGEPMGASVLHRRDDVGGVAASGDQRRPPVDHPVPHHPRSVVGGASRSEQFAAQFIAECFIRHVETSSCPVSA